MEVVYKKLIAFTIMTLAAVIGAILKVKKIEAKLCLPDWSHMPCINWINICITIAILCSLYYAYLNIFKNEE